MKPLLSFCFLALISVSAFAAADPNVGLVKGQAVVVKIPKKLFQYEAISIATGVGIYVVNVSASVQGATGLSVAGATDWPVAGWPLMYEVYFEKAKAKDEYVEIEFRSALAYIKLRLAKTIKDLPAATSALVFNGYVGGFEASSYYKEILIGKVLPKIFTGTLATMPSDKQIGLLKAIRYNDEAIRFERFKDRDYLVLGAGSTANVYNSIRLNQHARAALVVNEMIVSALKEAAPYVTDASKIGGIKIAVSILYKDFLREQYITPHADALEVYAPYELVEKFFNLDITNQQLIDGCVVLLNGSRAQISLTVSP